MVLMVVLLYAVPQLVHLPPRADEAHEPAPARRPKHECADKRAFPRLAGSCRPSLSGLPQGMSRVHRRRAARGRHEDRMADLSTPSAGKRSRARRRAAEPAPAPPNLIAKEKGSATLSCGDAAYAELPAPTEHDRDAAVARSRSRQG
jgi:hypothetical protein